MEKETKVIFNPRVARALIKMGNQVVDIKEDKNKKGHTLLVFNITDKFKKDLEEITTKKKEEKSEPTCYNCYSKKKKNYLQEKGFVPVAHCKDIKTDRPMWIYTRSEELKATLIDYRENNK